MNKVIKSIKVYGMHCKSCEFLIENEIKQLEGVLSSRCNYKDSLVIVQYNEKLCDNSKIEKAIKNAGYSTKDNTKNSILGISILALTMIFLGNNYIVSTDTNSYLNNASYFMIFIVGVLSSLHCVGMCGGIMLSQTLNKNNLSENKSNFNISLKYNLGRVISYTLLGGIIGSLGSIFSLSMKTQGFIQIMAAIFMIIAGLKMFGVHIFKNISLNIPLFKNKCSSKSNNAFVVGLLNGFMPCGALQTMQIYSLGTGSFTKGALSMFIFALGTVPLMLGFGYVSSKLSKNFSSKIFKYSGLFIIVLGLSMAQRGLSLTGFNLPSISNFLNTSSTKIELAPVVDGYQEVSLLAGRSGYNISNTINSDLPIKLTLKGDTLTSCNSKVYFPTYNEYVDLTQSDTVVEIPASSEDIPITCWMGMLRSSITIEK